MCGCLAETYFCFVASSYSRGKDKVSWRQFARYLAQIDALAAGVLGCEPADALHTTDDDPFHCQSRITSINRLALGLLLRKAHELLPPGSSHATATPRAETDAGDGEVGSATGPRLDATEQTAAPDNLRTDALVPSWRQPIPKSQAGKLDLLNSLLDCERRVPSDNDIYPLHSTGSRSLVPPSLDDTYTLTARSQRREQLDSLLCTPMASHALQRERARLRTEVKTFFDCCEDPEHAALLSNMTFFDKSTNYCKLNQDKFARYLALNRSSASLAKCIDTKMHFIPFIQSQTDPKLGDCSYLDTCHKMSSCRYTHYGQLLPLKSRDATNEPHNSQVEETKRIWDYTRGEPTSLYMKPTPAKQWINCDITKLDFATLGDDFGVVIADPSWTIHMNLNYSSMKDDELLSLRMDKLQKEGLFLLWVTGRTIETGRDFLKKWGYRVENQLTWIKTSQLIRTISTGRTGHWLNHSKEHLLVGIKGNPKWLNRGMDPQLLISSTRETSRKPDELYGMVERLVGDGVKKLEIFGRQHNARNGWLTVGNQMDGTRITTGELQQRLAVKV